MQHCLLVFVCACPVQLKKSWTNMDKVFRVCSVSRNWQSLINFVHPGRGPLRGQTFESPTCAYTVWPRVTKFVMVTHLGDGINFQGMSTPITCGVGPQIDWGTPVYGHTAWHKAGRFCSVTKLGEGGTSWLSGWEDGLLYSKLGLSPIITWVYESLVGIQSKLCHCFWKITHAGALPWMR